MQNLFKTNHRAHDFTSKNSILFPPPPDKCPFGNCKVPVRLKKHGFYLRYHISLDFSGIIFIRRYICPVCGRTVSFLPMFALQKFTYSAVDILEILFDFYSSGLSLSKFEHIAARRFTSMTRRHVNFYRKRLVRNRRLIQYVLNLIYPECSPLSSIPDNQIWVITFLGEVNMKGSQAFHFEFSNIAGRSFMTSDNMVA